MKDSKVTGRADGSGADGRSIVLVPCSSLRKREVCSDLFARAGPSDCRVLDVSLTHPVDERIVRWTDAVDDAPEEIAFLSADDSATAARDVLARSDLRDASVEPVGDPGDLDGLAVRIAEHLEAWAGARVLVCFDSVTSLLRYADRDRALAFFDEVADRCRSVGALAHFHVDPAVHDDDTMAALERRADVVVSVGGKEPEVVRGTRSR